MTGIRPRRGLLRVVPDVSEIPPLSLERARAEQSINILSKQASLDCLHKSVQERIHEQRQRAIELHNKATSIIVPRFEIGDFFLVRQAEKVRHKLSFKWEGPRRIEGTLNLLVYLVERLDGTRHEGVHCARMQKYAYRLDGAPVSEDVLALADKTEVRFEVLLTIHEIGEEDGSIWLRLEWDGLSDERDWTWSPLSTVYGDVREMVVDFLQRSKAMEIVQRAPDQLNVNV